MAQNRCRLRRVLWLVVCSATLWALTACGQEPAPRKRGSVGAAETAPARRRKPTAGIAIKFPKDKDLPYDRFGLFIGIDKYADMAQVELDGSVNDTQAMRALFADRFGFKRSALLTDAKATRKGILEMLEALVDQVRAARSKLKPGQTISVVIYYAGHGSQVRDQATPELGKDEDDRWDETWVAHDSTMQGDRDVRDDEIGAVYHELIRLGAEVLLISDSCHSGTVHRSADFAKTRMIRRKNPGPGPPLHKFRSIPARTGAAGGEADRPSSVVEGKSLPGFVAYTACREGEKASEDTDDADRPCGRFTKVLRELLGRISEDTTYASLHRRVLVEFEKRYRYRRQTPQFHAVSAKRGERFLRGGYPPPHAEIVPGSQKDGTVKLRMGLLHGVTTGSIFHFYRNLDDLRRGRGRLAAGEVQSVAPATCVVRLDDPKVKLADTLKAKLDSVRMDDLKVHVATALPKPMQDMLSKLDKHKQLHLVAPGKGFTVSLHHDAKGKAVRFYSPEALPDPKRPKPDQPPPLLEFRYDKPADGALLLSSHLLLLARRHRLITLSHNPGELEVTIVVTQGGRTQEAGKDARGILRLRDEQKFAIRLKNKGSRPLYVTLFAFNPVVVSKAGSVGRGLGVLYPDSDDRLREIQPIRPGEVRTIAGFTAEAAEALERTAIKILAADSDIDFSPLVEVPPDPGGESVRGALRKVRSKPIAGAGSVLFSLLQDTMHGGPATRAVRRRATYETHWATATIVFDVEKEIKPQK